MDFIEKVKRFLWEPSKTFDALKEEPLEEAVKYYVVIAAVYSALLALLYAFAGATLTAPSAIGNYTLRAYTADGTGTPNSGKETDYKVITVQVAPPATSAISLTKTPSATQVNSGTSVTYTYVVTNTGETILSNVLVTDNILGSIGGPITLNAGASQTFTKSQVITTNYF